MKTTARQVQGKRPPTFYASDFVEVEIDVDPSDLEAAGWVYVGKKGDDAEPSTETVLDTVRRWHDDNHREPWRFCRHALCDELRGRES